MASIRLTPHNGELRGLALIISVDGNATQVVQVATKHQRITHGSVVVVELVPVFDGPPATLQEGEGIEQSLRRSRELLEQAVPA